MGPQPCPARGPKGSRRVRLVNIPFLHAKPTWGDVIVVSPVVDSFLTWDSGGVPWSKIGTRIAKDGGRYAMIVDYAPHGTATDAADRAYAALRDACETSKVLEKPPIVCEGAFGPRSGKPGRAYLAVKNELRPTAVMKRLAASDLPCELTLVHPAPRKRRASAAKPAAKPPARTRRTARRVLH